MATTDKTAKDTAWNLMAILDNLDTVGGTTKGTTDTGVHFVTTGGNLPAEVMEVLARYDYCVDAKRSGECNWIAIKQS